MEGTGKRIRTVTSILGIDFIGSGRFVLCCMVLRVRKVEGLVGIDNMELLSARQWIERQQLAKTVFLKSWNSLLLSFCP